MFDTTTSVSDYMSIILTHQCNRNCPFCVDRYRNTNTATISLENVQRALEAAKVRG